MKASSTCISSSRKSPSPPQNPEEKCPAARRLDVDESKHQLTWWIVMSLFMYLYRGGEAGGTPEHMQQQMQKWLTWLQELTPKGHFKTGGAPLEPSGKD